MVGNMMLEPVTLLRWYRDKVTPDDGFARNYTALCTLPLPGCPAAVP